MPLLEVVQCFIKVDTVAVFDVFKFGLREGVLLVEGFIIVFDREDGNKHKKADRHHAERDNTDEQFGFFGELKSVEVVVCAGIKGSHGPSFWIR